VQLPPEDARDMSTFNKVPYWLVVEYVLVKDGLSEAAAADRHAAIKAIRDVRLCEALLPSSSYFFLCRFAILWREILPRQKTTALKW
jgi:hypothetical protein